MAKVRTSAYRQPPTAGGLKAIEEGTLNWFDTEMFSNFNTEVLEEYLDEKNRNESFGRITWNWNQILIGLTIGMLFAIINQYVGLKVGLIVSGAWYVAYLLGLSLKWTPGEVNVSAATSTGAAMICTGFVFTYPAIYLLAKSPRYMSGGEFLIDDALLLPDSWALAGVALLATVLGGFLGVMYFIIFRRVWLIEDPLPLPGFEAYIKLADIANDVTQGSSESAKESIRTVGIWTGIVALWTFLRDFELWDTGAVDAAGDTVREPTMDKIFGGEYYHAGEVIQPLDSANYTWLGFAFTPLMGAIGWFMRFRVALLVSLGTFFTWFVVTPLAYHFDVPFYHPGLDTDLRVTSFQDFGVGASLISYSYVARPIAIGAILGGGITGLLKMAPVFKTAGADVVDIIRGSGDGSDSGYVEGKGWYEWPISHILYMMIIAFVGIGTIFATEFGVVAAFIFSFVLITTTFALGAIAVKVMGETSIEPVSGTSFIVLLMLVSIFKYGLGMSNSEAGLLGLVGTTVFGGAISMSGDVIADFKNALYIGNRPYHILKAELTGILPGAIIAGLAASILSLGLAEGDLVLYAPQANAFASFAQIMLGGETPWNLLLIGIMIGVFMELITGMGTAFGLGMYLPLSITLPMVVGGAARDYWEKNVLDRDVKALDLSERERTLKLLKTYMIATGMILGEALMGTIIAIYLVLPLLTGG